jgi:hypothetical protein
MDAKERMKMSVSFKLDALLQQHAQNLLYSARVHGTLPLIELSAQLTTSNSG